MILCDLHVLSTLIADFPEMRLVSDIIYFAHIINMAIHEVHRLMFIIVDQMSEVRYKLKKTLKMN